MVSYHVSTQTIPIVIEFFTTMRDREKKKAIAMKLLNLDPWEQNILILHVMKWKV